MKEVLDMGEGVGCLERAVEQSSQGGREGV